MNPIGGQEAVFDSLLQTVRIEGVAEVVVGCRYPGCLLEAAWPSFRAGRLVQSIPGSLANYFHPWNFLGGIHQ